MATAKAYTMDGREMGSVELNDSVFGTPLNETLVHMVVVAQQAAKRQGTHDTKTRAFVSGGGIKPFRQKGTGRSRQGSSREPQMKGGGTVWGPHPRGYRQNITPRAKRQALCCVLSECLRNEGLCVLDTLTFDVPKTKRFAEMLGLVSPEGRKTLFVTADVNANALLSSRNLPRVTVCTASDLNTVDVLNATRVVLVRDAVVKLEERLA